MVETIRPPSFWLAIALWLAFSFFTFVLLMVSISDEALLIAWSIIASLIILTLFLAVYIYDHAKAYGRNAVAWATAFVVFTPLWAGIVYLLTWPKDATLRRPEPNKKGEKERVVTNWVCNECGSKIHKNDRFCATCGVEFEKKG